MNFSDMLARINRKNLERTIYPSQEYALYVRWLRMKMGLNRDSLAKLTCLSAEFLFNLENRNLVPDELTKEAEEKIAWAFGMSFDDFMLLNKSLVQEYLKEEAEYQKESDKRLEEELREEGYIK